MMDKILVEWVTPPYFDEHEPFCPWCGNFQGDDHREDCSRIIAVTSIQVAEAEIERLQVTFDQQELEEIIQAVSSANNTDAMPAHSWARASKVLFAEVERLRSELEKKESQNDSLREMVSVSAAEVGRLRQERDEANLYHHLAEAGVTPDEYWESEAMEMEK